MPNYSKLFTPLLILFLIVTVPPGVASAETFEYSGFQAHTGSRLHNGFSDGASKTFTAPYNGTYSVDFDWYHYQSRDAETEVWAIIHHNDGTTNTISHRIVKTGGNYKSGTQHIHKDGINLKKGEKIKVRLRAQSDRVLVWSVKSRVKDNLVINGHRPPNPPTNPEPTPGFEINSKTGTENIPLKVNISHPSDKDMNVEFFSGGVFDEWKVSNEIQWLNGTLKGTQVQNDSLTTNFGNNLIYNSEPGYNITYDSVPPGWTSTGVNSYHDLSSLPEEDISIDFDLRFRDVHGPVGATLFLTDDPKDLSNRSLQIHIGTDDSYYDEERFSITERFDGTVNNLYNSGTRSESIRPGDNAHLKVYYRESDGNIRARLEYDDGALPAHYFDSGWVKTQDSINPTAFSNIYYSPGGYNSHSFSRLETYNSRVNVRSGYGWWPYQDIKPYQKLSVRGITSGGWSHIYFSEWHDWGKNVSPNTLYINSTPNNGKIRYTIQASDDSNFSSIKDTQSGTLEGGEEHVPLSNLSVHRYTRVKYYLTGSDSGKPVIHSFSIGSNPHLIGVDRGVGSGETASVIWHDLKEGTHEWMVRVTDTYGESVTSDTWSFTISKDDVSGEGFRLLDTNDTDTNLNTSIFSGAPYVGFFKEDPYLSTLKEASGTSKTTDAITENTVGNHINIPIKDISIPITSDQVISPEYMFIKDINNSSKVNQVLAEVKFNQPNASTVTDWYTVKNYELTKLNNSYEVESGNVEISRYKWYPYISNFVNTYSKDTSESSEIPNFVWGETETRNNNSIKDSYLEIIDVTPGATTEYGNKEWVVDDDHVYINLMHDYRTSKNVESIHTNKENISVYIIHGDGSRTQLQPKKTINYTNKKIDIPKTDTNHNLFGIDKTNVVENNSTIVAKGNISLITKETITTYPGFEVDPPGTSKNQITGWFYYSESRAGAIAGEQAEIIDSKSFKGTQSLKIMAKSSPKSCYNGWCQRDAKQVLVANNGEPISTNANFVTVWISDRQWRTPARFDFRQELFFNNGAYPSNNPFQPDERVRIFRDQWSQHMDKAVETRTGSDGEEWKRYTVKIPDTIDKNNFSVGFLNHMDTWGSQSGWGGATIDSMKLTNKDGDAVGPVCTQPPCDGRTVTKYKNVSIQLEDKVNITPVVDENFNITTRKIKIPYLYGDQRLIHVNKKGPTKYWGKTVITQPNNTEVTHSPLSIYPYVSMINASRVSTSGDTVSTTTLETAPWWNGDIVETYSLGLATIHRPKPRYITKAFRTQSINYSVTPPNASFTASNQTIYTNYVMAPPNTRDNPATFYNTSLQFYDINGDKLNHKQLDPITFNKSRLKLNKVNDSILTIKLTNTEDKPIPNRQLQLQGLKENTVTTNQDGLAIAHINGSGKVSVTFEGDYAALNQSYDNYYTSDSEAKYLITGQHSKDIMGYLTEFGQIFKAGSFFLIMYGVLRLWKRYSPGK